MRMDRERQEYSWPVTLVTAEETVAPHRRF